MFEAWLNSKLGTPKGAAAHVQVEGEWDNDLLEQVKKTAPIQK